MISESDSDTELHASRLAAISRKESRKRENRKYYLKNKKIKRPKVKGQVYGSDQNNFLDSDLEINQNSNSESYLEEKINLNNISGPSIDSNISYSVDQFSEDDQFNPTFNECSLSDQSNQNESTDTSSDENDSLTENQAEFIYKDSNITLNEFADSLVLLKYRHKLSEAAVDDILNLVKILIPSPNKCPKTSRTLVKNIPNDVDVKDFLVCTNCKITIPFAKLKICESCSLGELVQFSIFDIVPQIQKIVSNDKYFNQIKMANNRIRQNQILPPDEILSALDGKLFSSLPINEELYLSVDVNSDGAPTIKSRQFALWPVLGRLVELNQSSIKSKI